MKVGKYIPPANILLRLVSSRPIQSNACFLPNYRKCVMPSVNVAFGTYIRRRPTSLTRVQDQVGVSETRLVLCQAVSVHFRLVQLVYYQDTIG